jgi:hypothetical protein
MIESRTVVDAPSLYSDIPEIGHPFWPSFGLTDLTNGFIQLLAEKGEMA